MRNVIMVPLDGTRFAEAALPVAMRLAGRDGLPLRIVTVWEPERPLFEGSGRPEQGERERHRERHEYMAETAKKVEAASGCPVSVEYLKGRPDEMLPSLTQPGGVDLVVMATHAPGPVELATLGSVADEMVRKGASPVLLVRPEASDAHVELAPANPLRRILVPLDGSELAERALQESLLTGTGEPTEITLLCVLAFPLTPTERATTTVDGRVVRDDVASAEEYLAEVAKRLAHWNSRISTRAVEDISPWTGIVDHAAIHGFDLIAMTTHGRGGASRLLMGSIANRVLRMSKVPVLLFHPEKAVSPWQDMARLAGQVIGMP